MGQPGAPNRLPVLAIHDNYIHRSVVDLDQVHGCCGCREETLSGPSFSRALFAPSRRRIAVRVYRFRPPSYGAIVGDC